MATPVEIMRTMINNLREGSLSRKTHVISNMATGVKACVGKGRGQCVVRFEIEDNIVGCEKGQLVQEMVKVRE